MRESNILDSLVNFWETHKSEDIPKTTTSDNDRQSHFTDAKLYKLALTGAIEQAQDKDIHHLNNCSNCLSRWHNWHNAIYYSKNNESEVNVTLAYGSLQAAATESSSKEPISAKSTCGRFLLNLYPQENSSDSFMITLETLAENGADYEGDIFQVRDTNNQLLLDGIMQNRRLARLKKGIQLPDLTRWTLTQKTADSIA